LIFRKLLISKKTNWWAKNGHTIPASLSWYSDTPKLPSQRWNVVLLQQNYASNLDGGKIK